MSFTTILDRLIGRGDSVEGWAARHIDVCLTAFDTEISEVKIITDGKSIDETASEIVVLSNILMENMK